MPQEEDTILDPAMDLTRDMDFVKGSKGISYWFSTIKDIPKELFRKHVRGKLFLDIGCGDGRILALAMICGAKRFHGVEIDGKFIQGSSMQRHIKNCDFRQVDISQYNCIYYFLGSVEKTPPEGTGEPELVEYLKNFRGDLIIYYRKVAHRLQKLHDNLISEGFAEIDNSEYIRVYRRGQNGS